MSARVVPRADSIFSSGEEAAIDALLGEGEANGACCTILLCVTIILVALATTILITTSIPEQSANDYDSPHLRGSDDNIHNATGNFTGDSLSEDYAP